MSSSIRYALTGLVAVLMVLLIGTPAAHAQFDRGTTFFANNRQGIDFAAIIVEAVPCADKVRFASTGSEGDAFSIRLAGAYRGRDKILKFEGGDGDYGLIEHRD